MAEQGREIQTGGDRFTQIGSSQRAAELLAQEFQAVVKKQRDWAIAMGKKSHIIYEAWQYLGQRAGLVAGTESCDAMFENGEYIGHKAKAVVRRIDTGQIISEAICECHADEIAQKADGTIYRRWLDVEGNPVRHSIAGMSQTRAGSRALASALRFLAVMAGFSGTPAEEMPQGGGNWENGKSGNGGGADRPATEKQLTAVKNILKRFKVDIVPPSDLMSSEVQAAFKAKDASAMSQLCEMWAASRRPAATQEAEPAE